MILLIQGAVESEICYYLEQECFLNARKIEKNGFSFYRAEQGKNEIIIQLTKMGMMNASMATMTAIYEFHPNIILNQGTAGAQVSHLKSGDIVVGRQAVNVHSLKMPKRDFGEGICPDEWEGMHTEYIDANSGLVERFEKELGGIIQNGNVVSGILGTGDLFSREKDRIRWLNETFGNLSEDMESFAVYAVCRACGVPCVSIRVISNNELLDEDYDETTALELQRGIWEIVKERGTNEAKNV